MHYKMNECYGKKFILNGMLETADSFDNSLVYEGDSVYEVIQDGEKQSGLLL